MVLLSSSVGTEPEASTTLAYSVPNTVAIFLPFISAMFFSGAAAGETMAVLQK